MSGTGDDAYLAILATSGKLKLRAKARLAEGSPETTFDACVLLHEAARFQHAAIVALPTCPPVTRLTAAVEECWCLVEGRDPPRAADVWGQVLRARAYVDSATADAVVAKVAPRYEASKNAFSRAIRSSESLAAIREARALVGLPEKLRGKARAEVRNVLEQFPGAVSFWWMSYRLAEASSDKTAAWDSLDRARRLDPHNPRFAGISLVAATWALPRPKADAYIAKFSPTLETASAEVCLMYALAEMKMARSGPPAETKARWLRARDAANAGLSRTNETLRGSLRATQLVLGELLAGREPKIDILYVAGLTDLAATAKPDANVVDLLNKNAGIAVAESEKAAA